MDPADGWPRVSQLTGMAFQVCLIFMSSQGMTSVATSVRDTAAKKKRTKSHKCGMSIRGQSGVCGLEG